MYACVFRMKKNCVNTKIIIIKTTLYLQYIRQEHQNWKHDKQNQTICFEEDAITLDLPESPPMIVDQWKITPLTPPRVTYL